MNTLNIRKPELVYGPDRKPIWPTKEQYAAMSESELHAWDALVDVAQEREAEAYRSAAKQSRGAALRARLAGAPFGFIEDVANRTKGRQALLVAKHMFRQTTVCSSKTVGLVTAELERWGIDKEARNRAVASLAAAGFIKPDKSRGRKTLVTLLWQPTH